MSFGVESVVDDEDVQFGLQCNANSPQAQSQSQSRSTNNDNSGSNYNNTSYPIEGQQIQHNHHHQQSYIAHDNHLPHNAATYNTNHTQNIHHNNVNNDSNSQLPYNSPKKRPTADIPTLHPEMLHASRDSWEHNNNTITNNVNFYNSSALHSAYNSNSNYNSSNSHDNSSGLEYPSRPERSYSTNITNNYDNKPVVLNANMRAMSTDSYDSNRGSSREHSNRGSGSEKITPRAARMGTDVRADFVHPPLPRHPNIHVEQMNSNNNNHNNNIAPGSPSVRKQTPRNSYVEGYLLAVNRSQSNDRDLADQTVSGSRPTSQRSNSAIIQRSGSNR